MFIFQEEREFSSLLTINENAIITLSPLQTKQMKEAKQIHKNEHLKYWSLWAEVAKSNNNKKK